MQGIGGSTPERQRPNSGKLTHSQSFMAIPKDKESLDDEIIQLKKQLHAEKADKLLLKTEFNRLREFVGKIRKERMSEARKAPNSRKSKNSDLGDVMPVAAGNTSVVSDQDDQNTKLRLRITKMQSRLGELKEEINDKDDILAKYKGKTTSEVEYSAKLRKDLLE